MSKAAHEQGMCWRRQRDSWWVWGAGRGGGWWRGEEEEWGGGERNSPRRHDACLACFPASRVGAWKGAGRLHPSEKKPPYPLQHLDVIWANGLGAYSIVINMGGLVAFVPPFSRATPPFVFVFRLIFHPSYLLPLAPSNILISPHPRPSLPPRVFILFCGELCYDKGFTPRMHAVSACVMPLWGMGALTSTASTTRPALPRQRVPRGGAGGGWRRVTPAHTLSCLALMETLHTHTHTLIENSWRKSIFWKFLFCSHGKSKMLTWDFLAIFLSRCIASFLQALDGFRIVYHPSQTPGGLDEIM